MNTPNLWDTVLLLKRIQDVEGYVSGGIPKIYYVNKARCRIQLLLSFPYVKIMCVCMNVNAYGKIWKVIYQHVISGDLGGVEVGRGKGRA